MPVQRRIRCSRPSRLQPSYPVPYTSKHAGGDRRQPPSPSPQSVLGGGPAQQTSSTGPVVHCDRVSVRYGKNWALKDVSAEFLPRRGRPARPERRRQEHAHQDAARLRQARPGADDGARARRRDVAARDPRPHRLHARERRAHSRHECRVVRRLLRPAVRPPGGRRDAARSRSPLLRGPRRGALSQSSRPIRPA